MIEVNPELERLVYTSQQTAILSVKATEAFAQLSLVDIEKENSVLSAELQDRVTKLGIPEMVHTVCSVLNEVPELRNLTTVSVIDKLPTRYDRLPFKSAHNAIKLRALSGYLIELSPPNAVRGDHSSRLRQKYVSNKGLVSQFYVLGYTLSTDSSFNDSVFVGSEPREVLPDEDMPNVRLSECLYGDLFKRRTLPRALGRYERQHRKSTRSTIQHMVEEAKRRPNITIADFLTGTLEVPKASRIYQQAHTTPLLDGDTALAPWIAQQYQDYLLSHPFIRAVLR